MRRTAYAAGLAVVMAVAPAAAQAPPAPEWTIRPSVYALGAVDESTDLPFADPAVDAAEPGVGANVGLGLDFSRRGSRALVRGSFFGLARNAFAGARRSYFGAGRVEASRRFGSSGRFTFADAGRVQRYPQLNVSDYWANESSVRVEWSRPSGRGFGFHAGDRRRALSELNALGFSRQAVGLGTFFPTGRQGRAELGVEAQHYSAPTARGGRLVLGGEWATFSRKGASSVRVAWFEPFGDRRVTDANAVSGDNAEFGDIGRAEFFETLALEGGYGALLDESFFVDPLESETDEWDFGRRKQVVTALVSRRLGAHTAASTFLRLQHRTGPNLLLLQGAPGAESFTDDRLALRATLRRDLGPRVSLLLHGAWLKSRSRRPEADFSRALVAFGVQIHF
jgi:hypothetical protein